MATSQSKAITLWVPGLLDSSRIEEAGAAFQQLKLPILKKLLARADAYPKKPQDFYQTASYLFHQKQTLPIASTMLAGLKSFSAEELDQAFWLKVDPVQVMPDRDTLVLLPQAGLQIQTEESVALMASFNQHFAEDGLELVYGDAHSWFLKIPQAIDLQTTSLHQAEMRSINELLPKGNAGGYWHQLMNETQMLFYTHPVNEARREVGAPEINSIWPWGEGLLDQKGLYARPQAVIFSENAYLRGMANLVGSKVANSPENHQAWLNSPLFDAEQQLITFDAVQAQLAQLTLEDWLELVQWLENEWLVPLVDLLQQKQISALLLDLGLAQRHHITPSNLKRFWRLLKALR